MHYLPSLMHERWLRVVLEAARLPVYLCAPHALPPLLLLQPPIMSPVLFLERWLRVVLEAARLPVYLCANSII